MVHAYLACVGNLDMEWKVENPFFSLDVGHMFSPTGF